MPIYENVLAACYLGKSIEEQCDSWFILKFVLFSPDFRATTDSTPPPPTAPCVRQMTLSDSMGTLKIWNHVSFASCVVLHYSNWLYPLLIVAVYIDILVMISIERSETNKKEHWKSETNLSRTMNFVMDWANAKSMAQSVTNLSWIFSGLFFYL